MQKKKRLIHCNTNKYITNIKKHPFYQFTRLDPHKRIEGNGLGLSIVKRIVEKLNGEVGVESANIPGEGSRFYFILPLAK